MEADALKALIAALALAGAHLLAGHLRPVAAEPRSGWLSAFAGVSVAYVFAHLLPELAAGQEAVAEEEVLRFLEDHVYLMSLLGLAIFYAVEQHSMRSRERRRESAGVDGTTDDAFRLSVASFAVYNAIVGYLLLRGELEQTSELVLYAVALGLHLVLNDVSLAEHHKEAYHRSGRYVVATAVPAGWLVGVVTDVPEHALSLAVAFVGGGVILNVLKEELPGGRRARVAPFAAGAAGYAAVLQLM